MFGEKNCFTFFIQMKEFSVSEKAKVTLLEKTVYVEF